MSLKIMSVLKKIIYRIFVEINIEDVYQYYWIQMSWSCILNESVIKFD